MRARRHLFNLGFLGLLLTLSPALSLAQAPPLAPRFDAVFGDASDLQRAIDRSVVLAGTLRSLSDEFARAVQEVLSDMGRRDAAAVARPYARAHHLGQEYLKVGRELVRHHAMARDLYQLGDAAALTPDYRARLKHVLADYDGLLADYREMKAALYDQLDQELRFVGYDPAALLTQTAAPAAEEGALGAVRHAMAARPLTVTAAVASDPVGRSEILFYVDNSRCRREHQVFVDGQLLGTVLGGARGSFRASAGPHDLCLLGAASREPAAPPQPLAAPLGLSVVHASEAVPAAAPGPAEGGCGAPGAVRRSYLHEGWTIALRCE